MLEFFSALVYYLYMKELTLKEKKKKAEKEKIKKEKEKYFNYYDDVKHFSKGKEDW